VKVGHVYIVNTILSRPKKDKITLCVCAADNLFMWLNTEPRARGVGQFKLQSDDHTALSHDCYLDCSRVTTFPQSELNNSIERDVISPQLAKRIVSFLEDPSTSPKTLHKLHIDLIIKNLGALN